MGSQLSAKKDYSVSVVRFLSMCSIIACHFMQAFFHPSFLWLNVGVYVFLWISGFLYGSRGVTSRGFLLRNIKKILVSYYLVFIPFALILYFGFGTVTVFELVHALALDRTIYGGSHLWFIPTILFCYIATPGLSRYFSPEEGETRRLLKLLCLLGITFLVVGIFIRFFSPAMISSYILGFYFARVKVDKLRRKVMWAIFVLCLLVNGVQILGVRLLHGALPGYSWIYQYGHLLLGGALFLGIKTIFSFVKRNRFLDATDTYSYEIYLVHHFFIIGPLSLMRITNSLILNIFIILVCSAVTAFLFKKLAMLIHRGIDRAIAYLLAKIPE